MAQDRRRQRGMAAAIIVLAGLLLQTSIWAAPPPGSTALKATPMGWQLSAATVVEAGVTSTTPAGTLSGNAILEAAATAVGDSPLARDGVFRLTLTAFSPKRDMPGQKAGMWYVQGDWTITAAEATAAEKQARHSTAVVKGTLKAELPFNPVAAEGDVKATVRVAPSPGRWVKGQGTFAGNALFEGRMEIGVNLLPQAVHAKRGGR